MPMLSEPPLLGFLRRREAQADTAPVAHGFLGLLRGQALGADENSILADPVPGISRVLLRSVMNKYRRRLRRHQHLHAASISILTLSSTIMVTASIKKNPHQR